MAHPYDLPISEVLENADPERPLIHVPWLYERLVFDRLPEETCTLICPNRAAFKILREKAPENVTVLTKHKLATLPGRPSPGWVVVIGDVTVGRVGSKINMRLSILARSEKHRVLCLSSLPLDPTRAYGLARALGVSQKHFGSYRHYEDRFCIIHQYGNHSYSEFDPTKAGLISVVTRRFTDTRFAFAETLTPETVGGN